MEYKITENTSISEVRNILSNAHGRGTIIMCENDKVFDFLVKEIDHERNCLFSKLRVKDD